MSAWTCATSNQFVHVLVLDRYSIPLLLTNYIPKTFYAIYPSTLAPIFAVIQCSCGATASCSIFGLLRHFVLLPHLGRKYMFKSFVSYKVHANEFLWVLIFNFSYILFRMSLYLQSSCTSNCGGPTLFGCSCHMFWSTVCAKLNDIIQNRYQSVAMDDN